MKTRPGDILWLRGVPRGWRIATGLAAGAAVGLGLVLVRVSNATSYLSNESETCINCHLMTHAYATWQRGSHGRVAVCNDCHVPHTNPVASWAFKARDGLRHSWVFTIRAEPQVLRLNPAAVPVVQGNCVRCHADPMQMVRLAAAEERVCWDCHRNVHGDVQSLSASPHVRRPQLPAAGLEWMKP